MSPSQQRCWCSRSPWQRRQGRVPSAPAGTPQPPGFCPPPSPGDDSDGLGSGGAAGWAHRGPSASPQTLPGPSPSLAAAHAGLQPCLARAVPRSAYPCRGMLWWVGGWWWVLLGSIAGSSTHQRVRGARVRGSPGWSLNGVSEQLSVCQINCGAS